MCLCYSMKENRYCSWFKSTQKMCQWIDIVGNHGVSDVTVTAAFWLRKSRNHDNPFMSAACFALLCATVEGKLEILSLEASNIVSEWLSPRVYQTDLSESLKVVWGPAGTGLHGLILIDNDAVIWLLGVVAILLFYWINAWRNLRPICVRGVLQPGFIISSWDCFKWHLPLLSSAATQTSNFFGLLAEVCKLRGLS